MLTRRKLLSGIAFGGLATGLAQRPAAAFTVEPMPKRVADIVALACKPNSSADHAQLIGDAQLILRRDIAAGLLPANTKQIVVCPICGCSFTVTADASN
jgi:hypothetical protein